MRIKNIFGILLLSVVIFSCDNSHDYHDVVYMTGTEDATTRALTVDFIPTEAAFSISASMKAEKDIKIKVKTDSELVNYFNEKYETRYASLPAGSFQLSLSETTILRGKSASEPLKISIIDDSNFEEGVVYLLPITIDSAEGIDILDGSKTLYFVVNKTIITQAVNLNGNRFAVKFDDGRDPSLLSVGTVTYEARIYVNAFRLTGHKISSVMGLEEMFLMRFGDTSIKASQLQIAKPGVTSALEFATGKWYHVAAVFNNGEVIMYIDGKQENKGTHPLKAINFGSHYGDPAFMIGASAGTGRGINAYISEARVWKRALSAAELTANVCYVDPTSPGLLGYWRFNGVDADGKTVTDLSGNGYHAVGVNNVIFTPTTIKCPE